MPTFPGKEKQAFLVKNYLQEIKATGLVFLSLLICIAGSTGETLAQDGEKSFLKGTKLYEKGEYEEAVTNFHKALEEGYEDQGLLNFSLGNAYLFWNKYERAIPHFYFALNFKYKDPLEVYYQLSTCYYYTQDYEMSIDFCNRIFEKDSLSKDPRVYWRLHTIYSVQKEKDKAMEIIKKGARMGIAEFQSYCTKRGLTWEAKGN